MSFINPAAKLFVSLIPDDARLLRQIYAQNAVNSQLTGWCSLPSRVIIPRFVVAPMAVPTAFATGASYGVRGLSRGAVKMMNMKFEKALDAFCHDTLKALQCTILGVASIAYAVLGVLFGARVFKKFVPNPIEKNLPEEISLAEIKVGKLKEKLRVARDQVKELDEKLAKLNEGEKEPETEELLRVRAQLQEASAKVLELEEKIIPHDESEEMKALRAELERVKQKSAENEVLLGQTKGELESARKDKEKADRKNLKLKSKLLEAQKQLMPLEELCQEVIELRDIKQRFIEEHKTLEQIQRQLNEKEKELAEVVAVSKETYDRLIALYESTPTEEENQAKKRLENFLRAQVREQNLELEQLRGIVQKASEEIAQLQKRINGDATESSTGGEGKGELDSLMASATWEKVSDPGPIKIEDYQNPAQQYDFMQITADLAYALAKGVGYVATTTASGVGTVATVAYEKW